VLKIQLNIEETKKAIAESEGKGLDYIEVVANAVPVPSGWEMVRSPDLEDKVVCAPEIQDEP
jgi:hypothetical protein